MIWRREPPSSLVIVGSGRWQGGVKGGGGGSEQ